MLDDGLYGRVLDSPSAARGENMVLNLPRVESEAREQSGRRGIMFDRWGCFYRISVRAHIAVANSCA